MSDAPANPFDADADADGEFLILTNAPGRYSLWPRFADVPQGWRAVHGPCGHQEALEWVVAQGDGLAVGGARGAGFGGGSTVAV
ncbi:MbtH family protein [Streptomyces sp. NPDC003077]|uniref:MbtH family protein n=1 Tax=Streptomyces sp. NPDC003077 TaxID=3154443 RepID=UPI0033AAA6EE